MASITSTLQIKFVLVLTCLVSINIADPNSGHPQLLFPSDQLVPQQKFLFLYQIWHDCHDPLIQTGNCIVDILKVICGGFGGGGRAGDDPVPPPAGGGSPAPAAPVTPPAGGDAPAPAAPPAQPPKASGGRSANVAAQLDDDDDDAGLIPGIGNGIPGFGGGIPAGMGGGLPGLSPACCEALTGLQNSCPVIRLNPFYAPFVLKFCPTS